MKMQIAQEAVDDQNLKEWRKLLIKIIYSWYRCLMIDAGMGKDIPEFFRTISWRMNFMFD